jgi:hypothetical protein
MNIRSLTLGVALLVTNVAWSQQPVTVHAQGSGCVRPATKEACFVLHDIRNRRYWDLTFDGENRPGLYTHIWFEGIGYTHDAHCNQGRPVHVTSWKVLPGECSKPTASESKAPSQSNPQ